MQISSPCWLLATIILFGVGFPKKNAETYLTQSNVWIFFFLYYVLSGLCLRHRLYPERRLRGHQGTREMRRGHICGLFCLCSPQNSTSYVYFMFGLLHSFALKELSCYLKIYIFWILLYLLWDSCLLRQKKMSEFTQKRK